jgi:uncharacterized protein YuzE
MSDKEEYIESSISLEGKYPRFLLDGDKKEDILIRFEEECPCKVVLSSEAEEDIGGALEIHLSEVSGKLSALKFVGGAQRWKLERVSLRYEEERDLVYMRFRWFLRQEMSLEIGELNDELVLDLDRKDRLIGFAVTNATEHFHASMLQDIRSDSQWIKLISFSTEFDSIEAVKAAKKARKRQKRALAAEAARAVATPSPAVIAADISASSRDASRNASPMKATGYQTPRKRRVYTGAKINLIPQDGITATTNLGDESQRTYFSNRFVRDLEWVLNFPFVLRETSLVTSSGTIFPPASLAVAESLNGDAEKPLPLVASSWVDFGKTTFEFLAELDANPALYLPWIRERSTRSNNLGGYFTMLIEFLLSRSITTKQVLPKYQMFSGDKRTVGDFDFLIQLKASPEAPEVEPWVHWEVGIKFYLLLEGESPETGSSVFVGPHCTGDSLEKYVSKTVRQLELCQLDHVADQLSGDGKLPAESKFFLKGYVFFPLTPKYYEQEQISMSAPFYSGNRFDPYPVDYWVESSGWLFERSLLQNTGINGGPVCGWWTKYHHRFPYSEEGEGADMSEANLELIREDASLEEDILLLDRPPMTLAKQEKLQYSMWTILNKMDYMAPILVTPDRPDIQLLSYSAFKKAVKLCLATNYRSLFVAEVIPYSRSQYKDCPNPLRVTHVEISRGFVVGEHWPEAPRDILPLEIK